MKEPGVSIKFQSSSHNEFHFAWKNQEVLLTSFPLTTNQNQSNQAIGLKKSPLQMDRRRYLRSRPCWENVAKCLAICSIQTKFFFGERCIVYLDDDGGGGDGVDVDAPPQPDSVVRPVRRPPHKLRRLMQVGHVGAAALDLELGGRFKLYCSWRVHSMPIDPPKDLPLAVHFTH